MERTNAPIPAIPIVTSSVSLKKHVRTATITYSLRIPCFNIKALCRPTVITKPSSSKKPWIKSVNIIFTYLVSSSFSSVNSSFLIALNFSIIASTVKFSFSLPEISIMISPLSIIKSLLPYLIACCIL